MKTLMKSAILICMMFNILNIMAQPKIGVTAGLNLSTMTLKSSGFSMDPKTLTGFNAGLISEFQLKGRLFLQPSLLYSTRGSNYTLFEEDLSVKPSVIEVPVTAVFKFGTGPVKFFLNAGPYVALGVAGKFDSEGESWDITYGSDQDSDMKQIDLGLAFGAGLEYNKLIFSASYKLGLSNLAPTNPVEAEMKSRVAGLSVAYLFGGK